MVYFDERYTTVEAEQRLLDAGLTRQRRKALRDQLAAQIIASELPRRGVSTHGCSGDTTG